MSGLAFADLGLRCCGEARTEASIYMECGLGGVLTLEDCIVDYPVVLPPEAAFPVPARGVKVIQYQGGWHVLDRIGEDSYPDPTMFLEEVRVLGLSRKIAVNTPNLDKLGPGSMALMVHDCGWINNWPDFRNYRLYGRDPWYCPAGKAAHAPDVAEGCCAGLWWENCLWLPSGAASRLAAVDLWKQQGHRAETVCLPCGATYAARRPPYGAPVTYSRAIIARFPIMRLAVVQGSPEETRRALAAASQSGLRVDLTSG